MYYNNITDEHTKHKYRIKTEEEFIDVYGTDWCDVILYGWNNNMNGLFGKTLKINKIDEEKIENGNVILYYYEGREWTIDREIVVELPVIPIYKPKKIKRTLENKILKLNEFFNLNETIRVYCDDSKSSYEFIDLLEKYNFNYNNDDPKSKINELNLNSVIDHKENIIFLFTISDNEYTIKLDLKTWIKLHYNDCLNYPTEKQEFLKKINLLPKYFPKKINRKL